MYSNSNKVLEERVKNTIVESTMVFFTLSYQKFHYPPTRTSVWCKFCWTFLAFICSPTFTKPCTIHADLTQNKHVNKSVYTVYKQNCVCIHFELYLVLYLDHKQCLKYVRPCSKKVFTPRQQNYLTPWFFCGEKTMKLNLSARLFWAAQIHTTLLLSENRGN